MKKGSAGFTRKEMWAPPDDIASPGRANSKRTKAACIFLIEKKTTVKEIRAHAFDYVTIATFKLIREINVFGFVFYYTQFTFFIMIPIKLII